MNLRPPHPRKMEDHPSRHPAQTVNDGTFVNTKSLPGPPRSDPGPGSVSEHTIPEKSVKALKNSLYSNIKPLLWRRRRGAGKMTLTFALAVLLFIGAYGGQTVSGQKWDSRVETGLSDSAVQPVTNPGEAKTGKNVPAYRGGQDETAEEGAIRSGSVSPGVAPWTGTGMEGANTAEVRSAYSAYNLPLVKINTYGEAIPDEPRIRGEMQIIDNGSGEVNRPFDEPTEYDGYINIEQRGESTSGYAKKSYTLELQHEDGTNNNVSVLGLPAENDFVLYGPYGDKTFMRNVLVYKLYRAMGHWSPRTRYVEVLLNGDYRGIYVWMEKIKQDNNRVDIDKIDETDVTYPDISGGYVLRRDKTTGMEPYEYWASPVEQVYYEPLVYQWYDPDYYELTPNQRDYIRNYMESFDEMMSGPDFADPETGYPAWIDTQSFIDMLIVNEFSKGLDCYMFSTYFYKENDEDGGKLCAGPPWDYNISMDNVNYGYDQDIPYVHSWVYNNWSRVYWWARLMEDEAFEQQVFCRWEELRRGILDEDYLMLFIDQNATYLGDAVVRNFEKYPILGKYIWPNNKWPNTYGEELENLKSWIRGRLTWMDGEWLGRCNGTGTRESVYPPEKPEISITPNPSGFSNLTAEIRTPSSRQPFRIEVIDALGNRVHTAEFPPGQSSSFTVSLPDLSHLPGGLYLFRVFSGTQRGRGVKLIKQ